MTKSIIQELKRRNVFRVAAIYVIVSWLLMQIGDVMFPALLLPEWTTTMLVAFLLLGFPVAMIFAWAYEITPDGVLRTEDVPKEHSIAADTGQKINQIIIGVLAIAVVVLLVKTFQDDGESVQAPTPQALDQSIAVLPFKNQSASEENAAFFAAGLHDELLTLLSKLGGVKVISRTSVERLDPGLSIPEIGALLGVATVLEGQVQRAGDRLRINVQLIDTAAEGHIWANTYDRKLTAENIFDVQSDIARTISGALHAELSDSDEALLNDIPTQSTEALERYLLGKQLMNRSSFDTLRKAASYFEESVRIDPDFAQGWAAVAGAKHKQFQHGAIDLDEFVRIAEPAVRNALDLNTGLSEAHAELGNLRWQMGDTEAAEAAYGTALRLNPDLPWSLLAYGTYLRMTNRATEAIPVLERALLNDPLSPLILFDLGKAEMYLGHGEKTLEYGKRILEIDPSSTFGYAANLQGYDSLGRIDKAMLWMIKLMSVDPGDFEGWAYMALWAEMLGLPDVSNRYMARALELGAMEPVVLKCQVQILRMRGQFALGTEVAAMALEANLDDRWYSNRIFQRQIRDARLSSGGLENALRWYRLRNPELFLPAPEFTITNVNAAADLALLLQKLEQTKEADVLLAGGLEWLRSNRPASVYDFLTGIVIVDFLALSGDHDTAVHTLSEAVDSGWNSAWPWYVDSPNFDSIRDRQEFQAIVAKLQMDMTTQREAYMALPNMGELDLRD